MDDDEENQYGGQQREPDSLLVANSDRPESPQAGASNTKDGSHRAQETPEPYLLVHFSNNLY